MDINTWHSLDYLATSGLVVLEAHRFKVQDSYSKSKRLSWNTIVRVAAGICYILKIASL